MRREGRENSSAEYPGFQEIATNCAFCPPLVPRVLCQLCSECVGHVELEIARVTSGRETVGQLLCLEWI